MKVVILRKWNLKKAEKISQQKEKKYPNYKAIAKKHRDHFQHPLIFTRHHRKWRFLHVFVTETKYFCTLNIEMQWISEKRLYISPKDCLYYLNIPSSVFIY